MARRKNYLVLLLAASLLLGSAAKSSAFALGDIDDDGVVRFADALLALRYIAGTEPLTAVQLDACNVNGYSGSPSGGRPGDPRCDITNAYRILRQAYGIITF
ncbi:MAG: hypothetical protein FIA91_06090 [Geobacter sp.]|nr:hypothetical protein [Geobacter sp.]